MPAVLRFVLATQLVTHLLEEPLAGAQIVGHVAHAAHGFRQASALRSRSRAAPPYADPSTTPVPDRRRAAPDTALPPLHARGSALHHARKTSRGFPAPSSRRHSRGRPRTLSQRSCSRPRL